MELLSDMIDYDSMVRLPSVSCPPMSHGLTFDHALLLGLVSLPRLLHVCLRRRLLIPSCYHYYYHSDYRLGFTTAFFSHQSTTTTSLSLRHQFSLPHSRFLLLYTLNLLHSPFSSWLWLFCTILKKKGAEDEAIVACVWLDGRYCCARLRHGRMGLDLIWKRLFL